MYASNLKIIAIAFLISPCIACASDSNFPIENDLKDCVTISSTSRVERNNLTLIDADLSLKSTIGECGCKSALASYTVVENGNVQHRASFPLIESRTVSFVVDESLPLKSKTPTSNTIVLGCGN